MNIFILAHDTVNNTPLHDLNARYQVDDHVKKIQLEIVQMLFTTVRKYVPESKIPNIDLVYKMISNPGHGTAVWIRECPSNYLFSLDLAHALSREHLRRYEHNRVHKSLLRYKEWEAKLPEYWLYDNVFSKMPIQSKGLTPFYLAIKDDCKISDDPVECYREYYNRHKRHLFSWKNTPTPDWIRDHV